MTFQEVQKFVAGELDIDAERIDPNSDLRDDIGADTIDMIELFMAMRNRCGANMPFEKVVKICTVRQLQELTCSKTTKGE